MVLLHIMDGLVHTERRFVLFRERKIILMEEEVRREREGIREEGGKGGKEEVEEEKVEEEEVVEEVVEEVEEEVVEEVVEEEVVEEEVEEEEVEEEKVEEEEEEVERFVRREKGGRRNTGQDDTPTW